MKINWKKIGLFYFTCNARPNVAPVEHITCKCGQKKSLVNLCNFICMWLHMLNKTKENKHTNDL